MRPLPPMWESKMYMIASNYHGQPSLDPRNTCGQLLTLPQVYLDLMFCEQQQPSASDEPAAQPQLEECLSA